MATTTPALTSPGIGSGLDVNAIVDKLMTVESQPMTLLDTQVTTDQSKISAFGSLKSALAALQTSVAALNDPSDFASLAATPGDSSVLTASVSGNAVAGTYAINVTKLAQAQKIASNGFANTTDVVGTGTLTFDFGTFDGVNFTSNGSGAKSVTIGAGQNTLAGIRDAVNAANIGVTATIVNDGSANGNRLVFTSNSSGASNSMKITVADADANNTDAAGLSQLAFDPGATASAGRNMTENVAAQNAQLTIDGIAMSKSSNVITDAIQGVTLTLAKTGVPTSLSVASNPGNVGAAVSAFVKAYNALETTFDNLTKYDASTNTASVLTGDGTVRSIQTQLRSLLGGLLGSGAYQTLSQVGVSFQKDGTLALDSSKLNAALAANPTAVTQLFAAVGTADDALVGVTGSTAKTQPGTYAVNVTQLATRGQLAGNAAAGLTITAGVNDQLNVTIDGVSATVTLAAGTYATADALASEVQSKINGASALVAAGSSVAVAQSGGVLTIISKRYGSASTVTASGSAAAGLLGGAPVATAGVDVAGTIGAMPASGSGQTLVGGTGTSIEGLRVLVNGGSLGARGNVNFGRGVADRLNTLLTQTLDTTTGSVATSTSRLQTEITDLGKRKDALQRHLDLVEANYRQEFNALDTLLSSLSAQSTALTQELATLPSASINSSKSS
jgi:flagellar hook-associated protein 2